MTAPNPGFDVMQGEPAFVSGFRRYQRGQGISLYQNVPTMGIDRVSKEVFDRVSESVDFPVYIAVESVANLVRREAEPIHE